MLSSADELTLSATEPVECLRAGNLVAIEAVDIELLRPPGEGGDHMRIPYLIEQRIHLIQNLLIQSM